MVLPLAEVIRAATPITNKNIIQPTKEHRTADEAGFNLQELTRVTHSNAGSELLGQNNALVEKDTPLKVMEELLGNPAVTLTYIKNIAMLREIVGLLPLHNSSITEEFEELFAKLMLTPEQITSELALQEEASTTFRGETFDFLRGLLSQSLSADSPLPQQELSSAVVNLLKAVYSETNRRQILDALSGSFSYLAQTFASSKELSGSLRELAAKFAAADAGEKFPELKREAALLLETSENSILFTSTHQRLISMLRYNLSRYNDNDSFLPGAAERLSELLETMDDKEKLASALYRHSEQPQKNESSVLDSLTKILDKQFESDKIKPFQFETLKNIVYSILSSPSNFTPLLHYIIPVDDGDTQAFAEMWINPDEDSNAKDGNDKSIHMLIAFDIKDTGEFEAELLVKDKNIRLQLYCPPELSQIISGYSTDIMRCISFSDYKFSEVKISGLERHRSLMEVFPDLPEKRTGLNIRI